MKTDSLAGYPGIFAGMAQKKLENIKFVFRFWLLFQPSHSEGNCKTKQGLEVSL